MRKWKVDKLVQVYEVRPASLRFPIQVPHQDKLIHWSDLCFVDYDVTVTPKEHLNPGTVLPKDTFLSPYICRILINELVRRSPLRGR